MRKLIFILFCFGYLVVNSAIVRVQYKHQYIATSGTSYAFTSNNTAGNFIVVTVNAAPSGTANVASVTVSDTKGNTYHALTASPTGGGVGRAAFCQIFYAENILSGSNSVIVTYTYIIDAGFTAIEYSGIATSSSFDVEATPLYSTVQGKAHTSNTFTPQAGSLIIGTFSDENYDPGTTTGTNITVFEYDNGHYDVQGENLSASSGSQTITITSPNYSWGFALNVACFKSATITSKPSPGFFMTGN